MILSTLLIAIQTVAGPAGHWEGRIEIPEHEMGITVDLDRKDGIWIGSVTIALSTSVDVPLADIRIDGASIRFTAALPGKASFDGKLSTQANSLGGVVSNIDGSAPFTLARTGEPAVRLPPPSTPLPEEFAGTWIGTVDVNGRVVRVVAKLAAGSDGLATGSLISGDGTASQEIPLSTVSVKDKQLTLESRAISGVYRGTMGPAGQISGEWAQRDVRVPLAFRRQ